MVIRALATYNADVAAVLPPAVQRAPARALTPYEDDSEARRQATPQRRSSAGAATARMTVGEFSGGSVEPSALKRQVPRLAYFYDDVENITRGRYERGGLLDAIG